MKKTHILDALQVTAALLITSSMVVYAAPVPQQVTVPVKQVSVQKPITPPKVTPAPVSAPAEAVVAPDPVVTAPVVETPVVAAPVASQPTTGGCQTYFSGDLYLDKIINFESSGNSCATNPGGCFGLLQACPGAPLREACGGDPACQIAWFQANKTGGRTWQQVWQHELDYGWW